MKTLTFAALMFYGMRVFASSETIQGFDLKTCVKDACVRVHAVESRRSPLSNQYFFIGAEVSVIPVGAAKLKPLTLKSANGYYDPELGYVVIDDALIADLTSGELSFY